MLQREWLQHGQTPHRRTNSVLHLREKEDWIPFFDQMYGMLSGVDLGNALLLLTRGTKLFLTSVKRGPRGTRLTPSSNSKVFCRIDIAYETNTQLELGCF